MAKTASWVFGVIFVIAGVWGFFSESAVGFIAADTISNIIHIVAGLVLVLLAGKASASMALKVVGIVYVILGLLGVFDSTFIANDTVTAWFYLIVGVVIAVLGFTSKPSMASPTAPQM